MRRTRVRTQHHEQVRKVRHGEAEIGGRIVVGPALFEVLAIASADIEPRCHFGDLEACRDHDDIGRTQLAIGRNDAVSGKVVDLVGDQFDVRPGQCFEPVIVQQDALAIGRIGRHALFDQVGPVFQLG